MKLQGMTTYIFFFGDGHILIIYVHFGPKIGKKPFRPLFQKSEKTVKSGRAAGRKRKAASADNESTEDEEITESDSDDDEDSDSDEDVEAKRKPLNPYAQVRDAESNIAVSKVI